MSWERIGTANVGGQKYDYYQLKDEKGFKREVVRVVHDDKLGDSEKQKPRKSEKVDGLNSGTLGADDLQALPGAPNEAGTVEYNFRQNVGASEYNGNAVPANAYSPPLPSAPVDSSKPTVNPKEAPLMTALTESFGGGEEGKKRAKAYIDNPPRTMSRDQWINQEYTRFYTEGGALKPEGERPAADKLNKTLASNLETQVAKYYVNQGATAEKAGETAKSFRVEGDTDATVQGLMAERQRQTTHSEAKARAMRPASEGGLGWTEEKWHKWALENKYETPAGLPARDLKPAELNASIQKERVLVVDETRLRGYLEKSFGNKDSVEAYMASAPKGSNERQAWVNKQLSQFETGETPPKAKDQKDWPSKETLGNKSMEESKARAQKALEEIYGPSDRRVLDTLVVEGFVKDPDPARVSDDKTLNPATASKAADRLEALAAAKKNYLESGRGKDGKDFDSYARSKGWIDSQGRISATMEPKSIADDTGRLKAYDNFRAHLISEGYSSEQADFVLHNLRVPPGDSSGKPLSDPSVSSSTIHDTEKYFFSQSKEARDQALLMQAQNNLVHDYAEKMKISPEAARAYLLSEQGGVLRKSATWEQVNEKQKRVAALKEGTPEYKSEADAIKAATGATPQNKNGDAAKIEKIRARVDPADLQYQDQLAMLDKQGKQAAALKAIDQKNAIELENVKQENAMKQIERRAELDKELEGIRHENSMKMEEFRQRMENTRAMLKLFTDFMQGMISTYAQAANADKQMLAQITAASINRMQQG